MVQKGKEDIYDLAKMLEPEKWLDMRAQKELPEVFSQSWLGDGNETQTVIDYLRGYFESLEFAEDEASIVAIV